MKIASRILSLLVIVMITAFYTGCKKDDDDKKTEEETQLAKLNGVWNLESASDGDPRTDFPGLVLTLSGNYVEGGTYDYSFTGERPDPSPWPVSGKWKFGSPKTSQLIRDPNTANEIAMTYTVNDTNLEITFTVPEGSTGWTGGTSRIGNVTGSWTFTFTK